MTVAFLLHMQVPKKLILASQSPRRAFLLKQIGLTFDVVPSHVSEETSDGLPPAEIVMSLARAKAREIGDRQDDAIIIGADTIVVLDGVILGKPASAEEAVRMLQRLSGRDHVVYTGFTILDVPSGKEYTGYEQTQVHFRPLREDEILEYVAGGSPMDKAGAYGIQDDYGAVFVDSIHGCFYTVVGFPLAKFHEAFTDFLSTLKKG